MLSRWWVNRVTRRRMMIHAAKIDPVRYSFRIFSQNKKEKYREKEKEKKLLTSQARPLTSADSAPTIRQSCPAKREKTFAGQKVSAKENAGRPAKLFTIGPT